MAQGDRPQHLETQRPLIQRVRRRGNIDQHAASLLHNFVYRVALVQLLRPKSRFVPRVFANRNAQQFRAERKRKLSFRRLKIARFVEHVVRRQEHLALLEHYAAVAQQRRGVGHRLAPAIRHRAGITHNRRQRHARRQFLQLFAVPLDKRRPLQQVLRRIPAQTQLRKHRQLRAARLRLRRQTQYRSCISGEIANGGIKLRESYLHACSTAYGPSKDIAILAARCSSS